MLDHSNLDALCHGIIEASLTGDDHGLLILPSHAATGYVVGSPWAGHVLGLVVGRSTLGIGGRAGALLHSRSQPGGAPPADITLLPPFVDGNGTTRRPTEHKGAARSGGGADRAQCALAQEPYSLRTTEPTVSRPSRSRWACAASCRG